MRPHRVSILGLGLLGGSLARAVLQAFAESQITGWDPHDGVSADAVARHFIHDAASDLSSAVASADLVVLCAPVDVFESVFTSIAPALLPGVVVTDVGSTKRSVVRAAGQFLPKHVRFVGSHPMVGGERSGLLASRADLFAGGLCLVTPTPSTDPEIIGEIENFWHALGMHTRRLSPDEHDALVADASHLPHAVAAALVNSQTEASLAIAARGFAAVTRAAAGDPSLWQGIFLDNRDNLRSSLLKFRGELDTLLGDLDSGDAAAVRRWLATAAERRKSL